MAQAASLASAVALEMAYRGATEGGLRWPYNSRGFMKRNGEFAHSNRWISPIITQQKLLVCHALSAQTSVQWDMIIAGM